jgi:hypothetical protein
MTGENHDNPQSRCHFSEQDTCQILTEGIFADIIRHVTKAFTISHGQRRPTVIKILTIEMARETTSILELGSLYYHETGRHGASGISCRRAADNAVESVAVGPAIKRPYATGDSE